MQARTQTCTHARTLFLEYTRVWVHHHVAAQGETGIHAKDVSLSNYNLKKNKLEFYVSIINLLTAVPLEYLRDNGTQISRGQEQS